MARLEPSLWRLAASSLALVVFIGTLTPPATAQQQEAVELLQQGVARLQEGNVEQGLRDLQEVIELEPRLASAHFYAGQASARLQQWRTAYDYFVAATEQAPGYGEAHMQASRVAFNLQMFDDSSANAIRAAQAGIDMSDAFARLEAMAELPENWRQLLQVPRVFVGSIDTEPLRSEGPEFGPNSGADRKSAPPVDPFAQVSVPTSTNPQFGSGSDRRRVRHLGYFQAQLHEVRRQFGVELTSSSAFGVVPRAELATYVFSIKADTFRDGALEGFVRLLDFLTGEEVYSRPIRLSGVSSAPNATVAMTAPELRTEIARHVGYLEQWLLETGGGTRATRATTAPSAPAASAPRPS